ncbi:hypothetical protein OsJ_11268 [Oryza sativa Japonica Group]|uniref:Uncharacterized protein n=1 Tax=Oryza sativa subsp. japonica TaxID=39947 RepID=A3AJ37_ORYSJ|nr:hypothetical protein OsJ_11268 [Oryza sativa Japonica Group]
MGGSHAPSAQIPFPDHIVHEAGTGFALGSPFHFFKGLRGSPRGHRRPGPSARGRPRAAGSFAAFFAAFCVPECGMAYARGGKEESWNFVFAGAATSGFLRLRQGAVTAGRDALWSAAFFALAEGASLAIHRALDDLPPADVPRGLAARAPVGRPRRLPASPGFPGQLIVVKEVAVADNEDDSGFSDGFFAEERQ